MSLRLKMLSSLLSNVGGRAIDQAHRFLLMAGILAMLWTLPWPDISASVAGSRDAKRRLFDEHAPSQGLPIDRLLGSNDSTSAEFIL
jgi:hypothetical protein